MDRISSPAPLRRRQLLLTGLAALPLAVVAATTFNASQAEAQQAPKSQTVTFKGSYGGYRLPDPRGG
ncbi:hypothetical protein [Synechococcus sp. RedBA-s]|uniref:hypothetical protein n=1 Tax=Synechococcus sp. RedBA-s TaxID=2823741 RepID=UPI0020CCB049|nr:hypothetical protein [Synechococcus sp. RedBA-s]MCP9801540.1 hypothetical protein [Synechococcus sp. RedBA-s]